MLDWNISYQINFNKYYPVNLKLVFKIPIKHQQYIYMQHNIEAHLNTFITLLDTQKFITAWRKSKNDDRFPQLHKGNEKIWRSDYKFPTADSCFRQSENNPIPIAQEIRCYKQGWNKNIIFSDNVTRTIWLLANNAEYFPVSTRSFNEAQMLYDVAGRNNCSIYSCNELSIKWHLEHNHLLPQVPIDD